MSVRTYNPSVRVGNWNEDIQLEEDTLKDFLERREKGELLIQKSGSLSQNVLQQSNMSISRDGNVHYGDHVMLVNPAAYDQTKYSTSQTPRQESALSVHMTDSQIHEAKGISGPCGVSASVSTTPSARNTFRIVSIDGSKDGDVLTYQTPFHLVTTQGELLLHSDHVTFNKCARKSRHQEVSLVDSPSKLTTWWVVGVDPQSRMELEKSPVPANTKIILVHVYTHRKLCVEQKYSVKSPFGRECEVSGHDYRNSHNAEEDVHHWLLTMNVPGSEVMPVTSPEERTQSNSRGNSS